MKSAWYTIFYNGKVYADGCFTKEVAEMYYNEALQFKGLRSVSIFKGKGIGRLVREVKVDESIS